MTASLRWQKKRLVASADEPWLDGAEVGRVRRYGVGGWGYTASVKDVAKDTEAEAYECERDARQDLESEVRRLLKEAGVEVGP